MSINEWSETILIAELNDEPQFSEDVDALMTRLDDAGDVIPDVIVDMKAVTYMNSSNIAQLLKLRKRLQGAGSRLRVCAVNNAVWSVLLITGLDKIFDFTDDVTTSLASLQIDDGG